MKIMISSIKVDTGFMQGIFSKCLYYIDIVLRRFTCFKILEKMQSDRDTVWKDYLKLCKAGEANRFLNSLSMPSLESPF